MTIDCFEPAYWRARRNDALDRGRPWLAVYEVSEEAWHDVEGRQRAVLAEHVGPGDSVLDAGCGWGRLLDLMPPGWRGHYAGVDLSPDFITEARRRYPGRVFLEADLRDLSALESLRLALPGEPEFTGGVFDVAVASAVRGLVAQEAGEEAWRQIEANLRAVARRVLVLEYDAEGDIL